MRSKAVQTNGSTTRIDVATAIGTNARVLLDTASEISYFVGCEIFLLYCNGWEYTVWVYYFFLLSGDSEKQ